MIISASLKYLFSFLLIINSWGFCSRTTIKTYHVFESFGTETQELKNSIIMNYNSEGFLLDSAIYSHTIPLSKKYIYVKGDKEGLKLQRTYKKEMILTYLFKYNYHGNRVGTTLLGTGDSLYWKEFQKYDDNQILIKKIRYNPSKAINKEMKINNISDQDEMIWSESYSYDYTGTVLEHKELYNNYVLSITNYTIDSLKKPIKQTAYFDPSVIFQTIFFHNDKNQISHKNSVGRLGQSIGSKSYEYDILGRQVKTNTYSKSGVLDQTLNIVYDDDNFKIFDYYSDSILKLASMKEVLLNNMGKPYIETILDGEENVLEKNVYYYDGNNRIVKIKQYDMTIRGKDNDREIPIRLHTYEYD
jgi:hypothetical protein